MLLFCIARDGGGGEGGEGDGGAAEAPWRLPNESDTQTKVSEGAPVNLQSYVETEFATFDEKPFNELDAALFTQLAMVRVELAAFVQGSYKLREDGVLVDESGSDELAFSLRDLL